jgi:hypothetical protein
MILEPTKTTDGDGERSEFAATVEQAERLLRKARGCYVSFLVGSDSWCTDLVEVPKAKIRAELKSRNPTRPFPCELKPTGYLWIGNIDAIEAASRGTSR